MTETVLSSHPLVGTWVTEDEDSPAVLTIAVSDGAFRVTGEDQLNGEAFEITGVTWDGQALRFETLMPSTQHRTRHAFRLRPDGKVDHELTLFEVWKKTVPT